MDPATIALLASLAAKGYQWYLGQQQLSKPTPFRPDWSSGDYAKLRADWEKGLQSKMAQARGAGTAGITEAMAQRGILSSGVTAGAMGEMETQLGEKAIQARSAFDTELYSKYMGHKKDWEAAERARMLAKDQLTMDLLDDIAGGLGIMGMQGYQANEWSKLSGQLKPEGEVWGRMEREIPGESIEWNDEYRRYLESLG